MERLRHILIILSCFFLAIGVEAKKWTPETLPIPYLQDNRQYVSNPDSVLDRQVVDSINAILKRLEKDKGIQTVVVAVKSIEGDDAYDFCMQLGRKYGIGSKESTGLIVFLATEDRTYHGKRTGRHSARRRLPKDSESGDDPPAQKGGMGEGNAGDDCGRRCLYPQGPFDWQ